MPFPSVRVLAEAAVTRDGDQAIRGSWLARIFSRPPSRRGAVYIFHRLEILFARSAAKLSRFEIFMNGSGRAGTAGPAAREQRGTPAARRVPQRSPPFPTVPRDLRLLRPTRRRRRRSAVAFSFMRSPLTPTPALVHGIVYGIPPTAPG